MSFGDVFGAPLDIIGGNKASRIERKATRKAGDYIDQGYQQGIDLAKPMQETAAGDYQRQSDRYNAGEFSNPDQQKYQATGFDFDPNSIFQDPEYQAQMRAGTQAIEGGAASRGGLFSGRTTQDLQAKGQDIFAGRSNELYNRGRQAYENDRNFDYGAENRAYDTNADNRSLDFNQGNAMAGYAAPANEALIDLGMGRAQAQAATELGVGGIRSDNYRKGFGRAGSALKSYGDDLYELGKGAVKSGGLY